MVDYVKDILPLEEGGRTDDVMQMAAEYVDGIDGQDATTPESHAAILRVIGSYCNELADKLTQGS